MGLNNPSANIAARAKRTSITKRSPRRKRLQRLLEQLEPRHLMAVDFNFTFFPSGGNFGFEDPVLGQARKDALIAAATEYGSWFNHTATLNIEVLNSKRDGAQGGEGHPFFPNTAPNPGTFEKSVPQEKVIGTKVDTNGDDPDGLLNIFWEDTRNGASNFAWEIGDGVEVGEIDFQAAVVHELTHIMGFSSDIFPDGTDSFGTVPGQPGNWQLYDQFITTFDGTRIIDATGHLDATRWSTASIGGNTDTTGLFFNGPQANAAFGGPVPLFSPDPFVEGSSVLHLRKNATSITDASFLMLNELRDGPVARRLHPVEAAMLRDLGYDITLPAPKIVVTPIKTVASESFGPNSFASVDVKLSVRPPTNVVVKIENTDPNEIFPFFPELFFTPENWNIAQSVLIEAKFETNRDGIKNTDVNFAIDELRSDLLYHGIDSQTVSITTLDNDTPDSVVVGNSSGAPLVEVYREGVLQFSISPFQDVSTGVTSPFNGVLVATGDINGDFIDDIITVPKSNAPLAAIALRAFSGVDGELLLNKFHQINQAIPVSLAAGDLDGDGRAEIVVGLSGFNADQVAVYDLKTDFLKSFNPIPNLNSGGVNVAVGDINGDGFKDIIAAAIPSGSTTVFPINVFSYVQNFSIAQGGIALAAPISGFSIAAANLDSDPAAELVISLGSTGDVAMLDSDLQPLQPLSTVFAFSGQTLTSTAQITSGDVDGSGTTDLILGAAQSTGSKIQSLNSFDGSPISQFEAGSTVPSSIASAYGLSTPNQIENRLRLDGPSSITAGEDGIFTATVDHFINGTPTGRVIFVVGGQTYAVPLDSNGKATFNAKILTARSYIIFANYEGDAKFLASSSNSKSFTVNEVQAAATTTAITSNINPSIEGQPLSITVNVSSVSGTVAGNVTLFVDGQSTSTIPLVNGTAVFTPSPLAIGSHTIRAVYNGSTQFLTSEATLTQVVVSSDVTKPTVEIFPTFAPLTNRSSLDFHVLFSEPVDQFTVDDITVTNGTKGTFSTIDRVTFTVTVTPTNDGPVTVAVAADVAQDAAGNKNTTAETLTVTVDRTAPTASITSTASSPTNAASIPVRVVFSEPVIGFAETDLVVSGGTISNFLPVDSNNDNIPEFFSFTFTPTADGTASISLPANSFEDFAQNLQTQDATFTMNFDRAAPSATISTTASPFTNLSSIPVRVTFTEPVIGFVEENVVLSGGTLQDFDLNGDRAYTFNVTPSADGLISISIKNGVAVDAAGNANPPSNVLGITSDRTAPTATLTSTLSGSTLENTIPFRLTFSEPVLNFAPALISVNGGALQDFASASPTEFTFNVLATAAGTVSVSLNNSIIKDEAGNSLAAVTPFTIEHLVKGTSDLRIELKELTTSVPQGGIALFEVTVTNFGPDIARDVTIQIDPLVDAYIDELISQTDYLSYGTLAVNQSVKRYFGARLSGAAPPPPPPPPTPPNLQINGVFGPQPLVTTPPTFQPSVTTKSFENDPVPTNNTAQASVPIVAAADVSVRVVAGPNNAQANGALSYSIIVSNAGPSDATNVVVTHRLPNGVTFDATNSTAGCTLNGSVVTCNVSTIQAGSSKTVSVFATGAPAGTLAATTSVTLAETDPNTANNSTTSLVSVRAAQTSQANAVQDAFVGQADTSLPMPVSKLLSNDTNIGILSGNTQPAHGQLVFHPETNAFVYVPNPGFTGTDSFRYETESILNDRLVLAITDPALNTTQLEIASASWGVNNFFPIDFQFKVPSSLASTSVLSAASHGLKLPTVVLSKREVIDPRRPDRGSREVLRWTMSQAKIMSYGHKDEGDHLQAMETYSISFDKIELDVINSRNSDGVLNQILDLSTPDLNDKVTVFDQVGPRIHAGFDFVNQAPFASGQFATTTAPYPAEVKVARDQNRNTGFYMEVIDANSRAKNQGVVEVSKFELSLLNTTFEVPPDPRTRQFTNSVTVELSEGNDAVAVDLIQKSLSKTVVKEIRLTQQQFNSRDQSFFSHDWRLSNVKVVDVSTQLDNAGNPQYSVVLQYEKIEDVLVAPNFRGDSQTSRVTLDTVTNTVTATDSSANFGFERLSRPLQRSQVLTTPSGDFEVDNFGISAVSGATNNAISQITFTAPIGRASQGILAALGRGEKITEMSYIRAVDERTNTGDYVESMRWDFKDVFFVQNSQIISDVNHSGVEMFTLYASNVKFQRNEVNIDGTTTALTPVTYDQNTGAFSPADPVFPRTSIKSNALDVIQIGNNTYALQTYDFAFSNSGDTDKSVSVQIERLVDSLTPGLLQAVLSGDRIPEVKLIKRSSRNGSEDPFDLVTWTLKNVRFQSFNGTGTPDVPFKTSFTLQAEEVTSSISDLNSRGDVINFATGYDFEDQRALGPSRVGMPFELDSPNLGILKTEELVMTVNSGSSLSGGAIISKFSFQGNDASTRPGNVNLELEFNSAAISLLDAQFLNKTLSDITITTGEESQIRASWRFMDAKITSLFVNQSGSELPKIAVSISYVILEHRFFPVPERGSQFKPGTPISATVSDLRSGLVRGNGDFGNQVVSGRPSGVFVNFGNSVVEVSSVDWDVFRTNFANSVAIAQPFRFSAFLNVASPGLLASAAKGDIIPTITVTEVSVLREDRTAETSRWVLKNVKVSNVAYQEEVDNLGNFFFSLVPESVEETLSFPNPDLRSTQASKTAGFDFKNQVALVVPNSPQPVPFQNITRVPTSSATVTITVQPKNDNDLDKVGDAIEGSAPNSGDGNRDGTPDNQQNNVTSLPHPTIGNFVTIAAPGGQSFQNVSVVTQPVGATAPPTNSDFRVGFLQYELKDAPADQATIITILVDGVTGFNTYYKYGPTPDNPTPHYYRFLFNGRVGAKLFANRIEVHLRDGELGDDDLTKNGIIVDPGAPAVSLSDRLYQNPDIALDVDDNGQVEPLDALLIINDLNANLALTLPLPSTIVKYSYVDTSGNDILEPLDALLVINQLNLGSGEPSGEPDLGATLWSAPTTSTQSNSISRDEKERNQSIDQAFEDWK